jgi:hypothetical protein
VDAGPARGARRGRGDPRDPLAAGRGGMGSAPTSPRTLSPGPTGGAASSGPRSGTALALPRAAASARRAGARRAAHAHPRIRLRDPEPDAGEGARGQPRVRNARGPDGARPARCLPGERACTAAHRPSLGRRTGELVPRLRGVAAGRAVLRRRYRPACG